MVIWLAWDTQSWLCFARRLTCIGCGRMIGQILLFIIHKEHYKEKGLIMRYYFLRLMNCNFILLQEQKIDETLPLNIQKQTICYKSIIYYNQLQQDRGRMGTKPSQLSTLLDSSTGLSTIVLRISSETITTTAAYRDHCWAREIELNYSSTQQ